MDSAGEPNAKRQPLGSPIKVWDTMKAHTIHSPLDKAARAVPTSPPGIDVPGADLKTDLEYVMDKVKELEHVVTTGLLGNVSAAETGMLQFRAKLERL